MEDFVTSDLHLGHRNILHHAKRPFSCIEEHDQVLIDNWNTVVPRSNSVVRIFGDFAWRDHASYLQRLNGKKILVVGSHDRMPKEALALFKEVHHGGNLLNFGNNLNFWCQHTCARVWEKGHYGVGQCYGHSHGRLKTFNMSIDVGVDSGEAFDKFFPIPIEHLITAMTVREEAMMATGRIREVDGRKLYFQDDVNWLLRQLMESKDAHHGYRELLKTLLTLVKNDVHGWFSGKTHDNVGNDDEKEELP